MTLHTLSSCLFLVAGLALVAACGGEAKAPPASGGDEPGEHGHAAGPHGGSLIVTGDHALHLEVLHDESAGRLRLHVLDADLKPLALAQAPVLRLVGADGSVQVSGVLGDAAAWVFEHALLAGEPEGSFLVVAGGKTYTPRLEHAHDHAGHEDPDPDGK